MASSYDAIVNRQNRPYDHPTTKFRPREVRQAEKEDRSSNEKESRITAERLGLKCHVHHLVSNLQKALGWACRLGSFDSGPDNLSNYLNQVPRPSWFRCKTC
eukprot:1155152-Pelagomonas_calceolata.AAC.2